MDRLHRRRSIRTVTYLVIAALVLPYCTFLTPRRAHAQSSEGRVQTIALLPMTSKVPKYASATRERAATDAVAIELEATDRFNVVPMREVESALRGQALVLPLDEIGMARVGRALKVDGVMRGWIGKTLIDPKRNTATVALRIELLDVEAEAILNGGVGERTTVARPGISVADDELINEATREAAGRAVDDMINRRIVQGTILIVNEVQDATINIGSQEGLKLGQRLLQLRREYRPETGEIPLRKIGTLRVTDVNPHQATAVRDSGPGPRREDFVRVMYEPPAMAQKTQGKRDRKKSFRLIAGLGVIVAAFALATGRTRNSRTAGGALTLVQDFDGAPPGIRLQANDTSIPDAIEIVGRLIHRGTYAGFPADGFGQSTIRDVLGHSGGFPGGKEFVFVDHPNDPRIVGGAPTPMAWDNEIDYFDVEGQTWTTIAFSVAYTITPLVPGQTYYYKLQNLTAPISPPGTQIPPTAAPGAATAGRRLAQTRQITVPEPGTVAPPSQAIGPITFILPPVLLDPGPGAVGADPREIEFVWDPSAGANEYVLEIFQGPSKAGQRVFARPVLGTGQTQFRERVTFAPQLAGLSFFTWRVGARKQGEGTDFVYSENRVFQTALSPPPPP
jgi:hypothetical protein